MRFLLFSLFMLCAGAGYSQTVVKDSVVNERDTAVKQTDVVIATYRNGYVLNLENKVIATYRNGYVLDLEDKVVATYRNGFVFSSENKIVATYRNGYIMEKKEKH